MIIKVVTGRCLQGVSLRHLPQEMVETKTELQGTECWTWTPYEWLHYTFVCQMCKQVTAHYIWHLLATSQSDNMWILCFQLVLSGSLIHQCVCADAGRGHKRWQAWDFIFLWCNASCQSSYLDCYQWIETSVSHCCYSTIYYYREIQCELKSADLLCQH